MLLPTMTLSEIKSELEKDISIYLEQLIHMEKSKTKYARMYIPNFPYISSKVVTSKKTNISYNYVIYIHNKYRQKDPRFIVYTKYAHSWGTTIIEILFVKGRFEYQIFTPHFIKRYRERMNLDESLSSSEVFLKYRLNNGSSNKLDSFLVDDEEKYYHDGDIEYYGDIVPEGACVCEVDKKEPNIIVHNTFISREIFFKSQDEASKLHLVCVLWGDFIFNYPRQKEALEREFWKMEKEANNPDELIKMLVNFIDNY